MKAELIGRKLNKGMVTLELLIAFTILILCITGTILISAGNQYGTGVDQVTFGNQSVTIDSQTNNEALAKAENALEDTRAKSRQDFNLVISDPTAIPDGIYNKQNTILDISQCLKKATSSITWSSGSRTLTTNLSTFLSDITGAIMLGGDCDSTSPGDWDNPITATSVGIGGQGATDINARNNFIYLTSSASAPAKEDFFIYQFDPVAVTLTQKSKINVSKGLNRVDVANNYAFTLNNDTSGHLKIFNISNPSSPTLISSTSLPNMTVGIARSIYYYNDLVFIGTQYLACPLCVPSQNNEFHIYDVSNPAIPIWKGSFKVNHNINDIIVRGNYAYLATSDDNGEVRIYDVSNPSNILFKGLFDAPGNEDGEALYLLGNKLYLGRDRTPSIRKDFYVLDISNSSNPTELGSKNLGLNPGTTVIGIVVKSTLAFIGLDNPTSGLQILDISNPAAMVNHSTCTTLNFSENSSAIDMDGDSIFSANNSNAEIRVIRDQSSSC
jgi:hypothetical protein